MTNRNKTVIHTGVTNDLCRRVQEHRATEGSSFAKRYNVTMLVYYESFRRIYDAIAAEKRIKETIGGASPTLQFRPPLSVWPKRFDILY